MKITKKVISIVLALAMVLCVVPFSAFADNTTAEAFVSNENLANLAERLLKDIAGRDGKATGTILQLVLKFVDTNNLQEKYVAGTNLYEASDEELADILVNWIDGEFIPMLNSDDLLGKEVVGSLTISKILSLIGIKVGSFKEVYQSLSDLCDSSLVKGLGDAKNLDNTKLKEADKNSNLSMINGLLNWLGDDGQVTVVKNLIKGELDLGKVNLLVYKIDLNELVTEDLNETMKGLPETIRGLAYSLLNSDALEESDYYTEVNEETGEEETHRQALADSYYADYTVDELLAVAVIGLLKTGHVEKSEAQAAASMTFYELLGEYAVAAIEKYALEPINGQFKNWLKNDVAAYENYSFLNDAINWDFTVSAADFNLDGVATEGLFAKLNEILIGFAKAVFTEDTVKKMNIQEGGNDKLQANLEGVVSWFIDVMPDTFEGFDFTGVKAKNATATLEEKAVAVLSIFWPTWFGSDYEIPADVTSLEHLGAYAVYCTVDKWIVPNTDRYADWPFGDCKEALLLDKEGVSDADYFDALLNVGLDIAVYALNKNSAATDFVMTPEQQVEYKAAGWTWTDFLDEIVDWGIGYIQGVPAITDEFAGYAERGVTDGFGAFAKINTVLNDLLPLAFFTDRGDGYFVADFEKLAMDKFLGSLFDFNISGAVDMLNVNNNEGNPFNKSLISAVLDIVENLLFSLFEYDNTVGAEETAETKNFAYTYAKGTNDKFFRITKAEAIETPVEPEKLLGDMDGDGVLKSSDARTLLRFVADVETLTEEQLALADVNGDGVVKANDAREILIAVAAA